MVLSNAKRVGVMKYSIPICSNCSEADIRDRIKSLSYHPTFASPITKRKVTSRRKQS